MTSIREYERGDTCPWCRCADHQCMCRATPAEIRARAAYLTAGPNRDAVTATPPQHRAARGAAPLIKAPRPAAPAIKSHH